ncbi:hypothetical protein Lal_00033537 [Lupinus albus]|nr:hypothetical protein Lal_00033537 [Lupinus albus]
MGIREFVGYPRTSGSAEFASLKGINNLSQTLLTMILPVATTTVERAFSNMKILKNRLRDRMGDA